jgi:hypothetical protein
MESSGRKVDHNREVTEASESRTNDEGRRCARKSPQTRELVTFVPTPRAWRELGDFLRP